MDNKRINSCSQTRKIASESCLTVLRKTIESKETISEIQFRDWWREELDKTKEIVSGGGWYDPPPFGMGVLFDSESNFTRVNYPSLRPKKFWPREDSYFLHDGLGYLFVSLYAFIDGVPIIGDFGFTFYLGKNSKIIDHFKRCWNVLYELIEIIDIGMRFNQLYYLAVKKFKENNLLNNVTSVTDKAGVDVGHMIPFIDRDLTEEEKKLLVEEKKRWYIMS